MRSSTGARALVMLGSIAACAGESTGEADVVRRDSAGITIVESPAALALAPSGWSVDSIAEITIGVMEGEAPYQLFRISGVAPMPDGRTLVVNAGTQELRFFDPAGAFLHSVGRQGQGPGEFQYPLLIPALEYDTIHVFDRAGRVVVFDSDGRLVRTHNVRMAFPVGILTNGRVLTDRNTALAGFDSPEGIVQNDVIYELVDPVSGASDTIAQVAGQALFLGNTDGRISFTQVPFDVPPNAATAGARFYVTPGEAAEVRVFDGAGVERERYRILLPAEPLSREAWDRIIVERVKGAPDQAGRAELERRYARMSPPAALPAIERILVDMAGHIWLERYSGDRTAPRQWFVLDATGRALGRVETPAGFVIEHIGRDFVLGRWPAGDDAERVGRYRLRRSPA